MVGDRRGQLAEPGPLQPDVGPLLPRPACTPYQHQILQVLAEFRRVEVDPRQVEAWIRAGRPESLPTVPAQMRREVGLALAIIDATDPRASEEMVAGFGL